MQWEIIESDRASGYFDEVFFLFDGTLMQSVVIRFSLLSFSQFHVGIVYRHVNKCVKYVSHNLVTSLMVVVCTTSK